ncbi:hypothetical protein PSOS111911_07895 [Pseudoalteromonas ostreae]
MKIFILFIFMVNIAYFVDHGEFKIISLLFLLILCLMTYLKKRK